MRAEFHAGARGSGGHAPIDHEAEEMIRGRLLEAFPAHGFRGEETGTALGGPDWWVVDPNDGTATYLQGMRGNTVSIGLVREGKPVLGVVYSPLYPDDDGDMFSGAEGVGLFRNGEQVDPRAFGPLTRDSVVMVSQSADKKVKGNLELAAPARIRALPSIAFRLALVAAGEADGAASLQNPRSVDIAAGHALVRLAGGELYDEKGQPVRYTDEGDGVFRHIFAGTNELYSRPWSGLLGTAADERRGAFPTRLLPGQSIPDAAMLARAQGCLLGQLAGDSLGALVEFERAESIAERYPDGGPSRLVDGGRWNTLAGQPTDDSEMALTLARALIDRGGYAASRAYAAYQDWMLSEPFDIGRTTVSGLHGRQDFNSQANGSLMRISPLGLVRLDEALGWAEEDSELTHPHANCRNACRAFVAAIQAGIRGADRHEMFRTAVKECSGEALDWLREAAAGPRLGFQSQMGWVRIAFHNAFYHLLHTESLPDAVIETVRCGGDTDTNAAIVGALLGAHCGREAIPPQWRRSILTCRPHPAFRVYKPRPAAYWPTDCYELAERLLLVD